MIFTTWGQKVDRHTLRLFIREDFKNENDATDKNDLINETNIEVKTTSKRKITPKMRLMTL